MQPPNTTQLLLEAPEAPPVPAPPDYLNLVSKPCSRSEAVWARGWGWGGTRQGTAFPGSSCKATIRKDIFKVKMKKPGCSGEKPNPF